MPPALPPAVAYPCRRPSWLGKRSLEVEERERWESRKPSLESRMEEDSVQAQVHRAPYARFPRLRHEKSLGGHSENRSLQES